MLMIFFLMQLILNSLPSQFDPFKDKWDLNELISMCVQEELRLRQEISHNILTTIQGANNKKRRLKHYPSNELVEFGNIKHPTKKKVIVVKCFFYNEKEHVKRDCIKYKTWFKKKGKNSTFVCFEFNIIELPSNI